MCDTVLSVSFAHHLLTSVFASVTREVGHTVHKPPRFCVLVFFSRQSRVAFSPRRRGAQQQAITFLSHHNDNNKLCCVYCRHHHPPRRVPPHHLFAINFGKVVKTAHFSRAQVQGFIIIVPARWGLRLPVAMLMEHKRTLRIVSKKEKDATATIAAVAAIAVPNPLSFVRLPLWNPSNLNQSLVVCIFSLVVPA